MDIIQDGVTSIIFFQNKILIKWKLKVMETWDLNQNENLELLYNFGLLRFIVKSWRSWLVSLGPWPWWRYFIIITWNSLFINSLFFVFFCICSKLAFFCVFFVFFQNSPYKLMTADILTPWPHDPKNSIFKSKFHLKQFKYFKLALMQF